MLKLVLIFLFLSTTILAQEPESLYIVSQGKINQVHFKDLKKAEFTTTNYHPKFKDLGAIKYTGYYLKDVLFHVKLKSDGFITLLGKTGQFSTEISVQEILAPNNMIATHINGVPVKTDENGLQIIYSKEAIEKFPHLKERQYWVWWVRSLITDEKFVPEIKVSKTTATLESQLPWPVPYGISSRGSLKDIKKRSGKLLDFKKMKVTLLNGASFEIASDDKTKYFLTDSVGNKSGSFGLHQILKSDQTIQAMVSNLYYVKSVENIE